MQAELGLRLGIDIGGTFTDLSLEDPATGVVINFKTPTDPLDPAAGVDAALQELKSGGVALDRIGYFVHGTTIGLNSVIQRSGARTALLVTEGFRDIFELARLRVPIPYSFYSRRPEPLVPRERVITVRERIRHDGAVETPLDEAEIERVVAQVEASGVESIAVCLLHSYAVPAHELRLKEALHNAAPKLAISCSCEIWPEIREYERALVTAMNAYVAPPTARYLERLDEVLRRRNVLARPYLTRSNGGIMTTEAARSQPVHLLLSGPASGVMGASSVASAAGFDNFITFDMGGTSADIAVVEGGIVTYSSDEHVGEFPIILPAVAISSIGAGGGSVATVDAAGVLRVGPESAGADPGPACYGFGGVQPTVTDAFLMCGYLSPTSFSGKAELNQRAAADALTVLGAQLGLGPVQAAEGIIQVALSNMYAEIRAVLDRRGIDPREFVLVAFGGAGPVVACMLAEELSIQRVLFPPSPGTLAASGALTADVMSDFIRTGNWRTPRVSDEDLQDALAALDRTATAWLAKEAPPVAESEVRFAADMRYVGQSYELEIAWPCARTEHGHWSQLVASFHDAHARLFGQSDTTASVELVSLRARAIGHLPKVATTTTLRHRASSGRAPEPRVVHAHGMARATPVYDRGELPPDRPRQGPFIVQQPDTTVVVGHRWSAIVDGSGNLVASTERES